MPVSDSAVKAFLEHLTQARNITSKKMFGGIGLYCDGIFFAVIDDDRLFFKVDEVNLPAYEEFGAGQWVIPGDPPSPMPYREVPDEILQDQARLGEFVDGALGVVARKKKSPSSAKKKKT